MRAEAGRGEERFHESRRGGPAVRTIWRGCVRLAQTNDYLSRHFIATAVASLRGRQEVALAPFPRAQENRRASPERPKTAGTAGPDMTLVLLFKKHKN